MEGDKRKSLLASCLFFLLFVCVLAVSTVLDRYPDQADLDSPTTVRRAVARWWGNATVDPCADFYNYSCQRYRRAALSTTSVLAQAQRFVIDRRSVVPTVNLTTVGDPIDAGIFPFYEVETRYMVVYVYPIDTNPEPDGPGIPTPTRGRRRRTLKQLSYQRIRQRVEPGSDWSDMLNRTATIFNEWIDSHIEVLLINDAGATSDITTPWFLELSHALNLNPRPGFNATNVSSAASACVAAQVADLRIGSLFVQQSDGLLGDDRVQSIVGSVVDALRPLNPGFAEVGLATGGPAAPCVGLTVSGCLRFLWNDQLDLLHQNTSTFAPWPFSKVTTNAVYNEIDNTVYIPSGLLSWPFYDPAWSPRLTLTTLGWIIAHEFSHSLPISAAQAACVDGVENVIMGGDAGKRANVTLNENYADHMAMHYITLLLRADDQRPTAMQESFTIWAQTWCDGDPSSWNPLDSHQTPALRVNATLEMSYAFTNAFSCPQRYPRCISE